MQDQNENRRSGDMIDRIITFNEFYIKKGASANAPFLKLQRSNYVLKWELKSNWKYFQQLCRKRFAPNSVKRTKGSKKNKGVNSSFLTRG